MDLVKAKIVGFKDSIAEACSILAPSNVKRKLKELKQMTTMELLMGFCRLLFMIMYHSVFGIFYLARRIWKAMMNLMQGPPVEQVSQSHMQCMFLSSSCFSFPSHLLLILVFLVSGCLYQVFLHSRILCLLTPLHVSLSLRPQQNMRKQDH